VTDICQVFADSDAFASVS